jgi:hypothetical protein
MHFPTSIRPAVTLARFSSLTVFVLATSFAVLTPTASLAQAQAQSQLERERFENTPGFNWEHGDRVCRRDIEPSGAEAFQRTELYFGSARSDGPAVTPEEFQRFVDKEITPRFPDGLTLLTGLGQFRVSNGTIEKERSMLLILFYPVKTIRDSSNKIEQIRQAYEDQFHQESVLRADEPQAECVSF